MGLIKAAVGAVKGTLADSWKEAIHCGHMSNGIIIREGTRMHTDGKHNAKSTPNVISNGSVIAVEENMCMLTIDNGKITNIVTEPGQYVFDSSSAPSVFTGDIAGTINDLVTRFTFGGTASSEQKVFYINLQPLPGIPFGTSTPMPYPDPRYNTTLELRFYGTFEIQIQGAENAVKFYREVASKGSRSSDISVNDIFKNEQYKSEFLAAMMQGVNLLSERNISYNQISAHLSELTGFVRDATAGNWQRRGFTITDIGMGGPVTLSPESQALLKDRLKADTMLGGDVQRAIMTGSIAKGIENASKNSGGAMVGFAGMNMANSAGMGILGAMGSAPEPVVSANSWKCVCGAVNTGKFCVECGKDRSGVLPGGANSWKCSCGTTNTGKFCGNCGAARPKKKSYKCNKCGFVPANPENPPKFCPECGDNFNDDDLV
ncbi:virion core protein [Clostridia bacterium]|nr:virion core protein [Clostridia bacterium]